MPNRVSVEAFPPAEYIQQAMDARGWTQDDLAEVMGRNRHTVLRLLNAKTAITPDTAHELAQAFETSAEMWMNLQVSYELALAAKENRDIERRAAIYNKIPLRDVKKRGWIPDVSETAELEKRVCRFLKIAEIADDPCFAMAARKSTSYEYDTPAQIAWYARAHWLAHAAPAAKYAESAIEDAIAELRKLAAYPEDAACVPKLLGEFGIRLLLVEKLPKSKVDGVAFWINDETSPVIALSLRYDRIDNFWHNLFHEIVHIKYRDLPIVDVDITAGDAGVTDIERRANAEASNYLIPKDRLRSFIERHEHIVSRQDIIRAAQARKIHPGILVGQLHGHNALDFRYHRKLLVEIRSHIVGHALTDGWGHIPEVGDAS